MTELEIDAPKVANEFLNLWEKAYRECDDAHPDYSRLSTKFALFTGGPIACSEAHAVATELHKGRQERGWPDPQAGTIDPGIEGAIMMLWLGGLRKLEYDQERRNRPAEVTSTILRIFELAPSHRWQKEIEQCLRDAFDDVVQGTVYDVNWENAWENAQ
jgi:hypothetical protein